MCVYGGRSARSKIGTLNQHTYSFPTWTTFYMDQPRGVSSNKVTDETPSVDAHIDRAAD